MIDKKTSNLFDSGYSLPVLVMGCSLRGQGFSTMNSQFSGFLRRWAIWDYSLKEIALSLSMFTSLL
jgi:hypothetical protein